MRLMIPPPAPSDFAVGRRVTGVLKNRVEFGAFIDFRYGTGGSPWGIDGLLLFSETPRPDEARALPFDARVEAVVTLWEHTRVKLRVALPADPAWLTRDVVALARGIRVDRAFDRLPILADALEEAGCSDETVLRHCRGAGTDASWLIPLLTGEG